MALIIMAIMLAIVLGLNAILIGQIKITRDMGYSVVAFYAAETGIENSLYTEEAVLIPISLPNGASYTVTKLSKGESTCPDLPEISYCLRSVGTFQGTRRTIQVSR